MAKRRKQLDAINAEGWMMSYADMATILLAMFIVLSTLGKDQTGINLYNGTGSFREALDAFGMPGFLSTSSHAIQLGAVGPRFPTTVGSKTDPGQTPPGANPNEPGRIIDGEEVALQQFLSEMGRQFQIEKLPRFTGQAVVDFFDRINSSPPYLSAVHTETLWQIVPLLRRPDYRVYVIVWATTPSESAWTRAA